MTGLEKMTAKIIADAEAQAREILQKADAECESIKARYLADAERECDRLGEQAERECEALITRARSSAAMAKRDVYLMSKSRLIDEVFAAGEKEIRNLPAEKYLELLISMLKGAIKRQMESEKESLELYGEDSSPEYYEVLLNHRDREQFGKALIDGLHRSVVGKMKLSDLEKIKLSNDTANINGGLILRCGAVEANCSLSMLFAEARRTTEAKVNDALFGKISQ